MSRIGERNRLIVIERATVTVDDYGGEESVWTQHARAWSRVRYGSGQERREAAQEFASQAATFECLWNPSLDDVGSDDRIIFDGAAWDITNRALIGLNREIHFTASTTWAGAAETVSQRLLTGSVTGQATATATLTIRRLLAGAAAAVISATGTITTRAALTGTAAAVSSLTGTLSVSGTFSGSAVATSSAEGLLTVRAALTGSAAGTSSATGEMLNEEPPYVAPSATLAGLFTGGSTGYLYDLNDPDSLRAVADGANAAEDAAVVQVRDLSGGGHHALTVGNPLHRMLHGDTRWLEMPSGSSIEIPAALTFDRRASTFFFVYLTSPDSTTTAALFNSPTASTNFGLHEGVPSSSVSDNPPQITASPAFSPVSGIYGSNYVMVRTFKWGASERRIWDGKQEVTGTAASAVAASAGGRINGWSDGSPLFRRPRLLAFAACVRADLADATIEAIHDELAAYFNGQSRTSSRFLIVQGTSLMAGVHTSPGDRNRLHEALVAMPSQLRLMYADYPKVSVFAEGGRKFNPVTTSGMAHADRIAEIDTEFARNSMYTSQAFILDGPTNDIGSDSAALADLQTWATAIWDGITTAGVIKLATTIPPRGDWSGAQQTRADEYNSWLKTTSPWAGNVIDDAADTRLNPADPLVYHTDQLHFLPVGHGYRAENAKAVLDAKGW